MRKRILKYIILLISSISLCIPLQAQNSERTEGDNKEKKQSDIPLFNGISVGVDISGAVGKVLGGNRLSGEVQGKIDLKNRFFPTVEIGWANTNTTSTSTNQHYKMSAPYFRIGADYNFFHKKTHLPGYIYGGLRYGFSSFNYDVDIPPMTDPTFGNTAISGSYQGISSSAHWLEVVAGVHVKVYKNFCMGWSIRYKSMLNLKKGYNTEPWYIPGFGKNTKTGFGVSYSLIYYIPIHLL